MIKEIKNKIYSYINKNMIKRTYDKNINNVANNKLKKFSYTNFENYIKTNVGDVIINNNLMETVKYLCGKKTLYIICVKAHAFGDDNIKRIIDTIDIGKIIDDQSLNFFK